MTFVYVFIALLIVGASVVGWDLYRSLRTGVATLRSVSVSRTDDRAFYWVYIGAKLFAITLLLYIAALFLALAFPGSAIIIWPMKG